MALVGYSESESSGDETPVPTSKANKPEPEKKTTFQKFTNSEDRRKIKVSLPALAQSADNVEEDDGPAPKRVKMSGGGFNSMLPAPKRPKAALATSSRGQGLGSGINLKTGAAPGFSRELPEARDDESEIDFGQNDGAFDSAATKPLQPDVVDKEPPKPTGSAMRFKPLSVSRKPPKKSAAALMAAVPVAVQSNMALPPPKPKASLFSVPVSDDSLTEMSSTEYKPIIYNASSAIDTTEDNTEEAPDPIYTPDDLTPSQQAKSQPQTLSNIADSLNLSASQRRQLMGRKGASFADANVVEFNTETEYAANEELRASGETATFNPVRSVAGGKHSLQQLVSMVGNQKDALEESFAAGRRNKREAGAKYGW